MNVPEYRAVSDDANALQSDSTLGDAMSFSASSKERPRADGDLRGELSRLVGGAGLLKRSNLFCCGVIILLARKWRAYFGGEVKKQFKFGPPLLGRFLAS